MINNFSNTEKSLKRYLKEKVTITTATVVSFLIAGTVAVAAEYQTSDNFKTEAGKNEVEYFELNGGNDAGTPSTITKYADGMTGAAVERSEELQKNLPFAISPEEYGIKEVNGVFVVDKNIIIQTSGTADGAGTIALYGAGEKTTENAGNIWVSANGGTGMYAQENAVAVGNEIGYVSEDGVNSIVGKSEHAKSAVIRNTGDIIVEAGTLSAGMRGGVGAVMENAGTITVVEGTGMQNYARAYYVYEDAKLEGDLPTTVADLELGEANKRTVINKKDGTINVAGESAVGMGIGLSGKYLTAGNEGTINVENGTGVLVSSEIGNNVGEALAKTGVTTFTNSGEINVIGEDAVGLTGVAAEKGIEFVNAKGASLNVTGGTGAEVGEKVTLTNEGTITVAGAEIEEETLDIIDNEGGEGEGNPEKPTTPEYVNATGVTVNGGTFVNAEGATLTVTNNGTGVQLNEGAFVNYGKLAVDSGTGVIIGTATDTLLMNVGTNPVFINDGEMTVASNATGVTVNEAGEVINQGSMTVGDNATAVAIGSGAEASTVENRGTLTVGATDSTFVSGENLTTGAKNSGIVTFAGLDSTATEDNANQAFKNVFGDDAVNLGTLANEEGKAVVLAGTELANDAEVTIGNLTGEGFGEAIALKGDKSATIYGSQDPLTDEVEVLENKKLNIAGTLTLGKAGQDDAVMMDRVTITISQEAEATGSGKVIIADATEMNNGTINITTKEGLEINDDQTLSFNGYINGTVMESEARTTDIKLNGTLELTGDTTIDANIDASTGNQKAIIIEKGWTNYSGTINGLDSLTVTAATDKDEVKGLTLASDAKFEGTKNSTTITLEEGTELEVMVEADGKNALKESVDTNGDSVLDFQSSASETIVFNTSKLDSDTVIEVGKDTKIEDHMLDSTSYYYDLSIDNTTGKISLTYDKDAFAAAGSELNAVHAGMQVVDGIAAADPEARLAQLDNIYSNTVYAETVKMSMDTLRMNEDAVLSLNARPEAGKWAAAGKALYSNTDYDRAGKLGDYNVETETVGLMGAVEYGVNETTSVGFAFSGAKQDLDMTNGSADGDAFYFGAYTNKEVGNIRLTAGLGYQMNSIEADNDMFFATGDDYDSEAFSGFVQGKYVMKAGEGFTVEPKAKLALTRLTQDSVKDAYFDMEEAKATTFDVEVGVDVVKTVALDKVNLNLIAGLSYTRTMGDTDDKFEANFRSVETGKAGSSFDVMGANLGENTLKLNIGAEVEQANGFFYNGGASFRFDNEDRESFGLNLGAGYKF